LHGFKNPLELFVRNFPLNLDCFDEVACGRTFAPKLKPRLGRKDTLTAEFRGIRFTYFAWIELLVQRTLSDWLGRFGVRLPIDLNCLLLAASSPCQAYGKAK